MALQWHQKRSGTTGGYFGDAEIDPLKELKEYRISLAAKTKEQLIRNLGAALKNAGFNFDPETTRGTARWCEHVVYDTKKYSNVQFFDKISLSFRIALQHALCAKDEPRTGIYVLVLLISLVSASSVPKSGNFPCC